MIDKRVATPQDSVRDIFDGAVVMVGGFGGSGLPSELIRALVRRGAKDLTVIANNLGASDVGVAMLVDNAQVRKLVCSYPVGAHARTFLEQYRQGMADIEVIPQGTLAERIRCAGAGIPAFYTPAGIDTEVEAGREQRSFAGRRYLLELALAADFALIKGHMADAYGNLIFRRAQRNFNEVMAKAAQVTIAEVDKVVEAGDIDPERVDLPAPYVQRLVEVR